MSVLIDIVRRYFSLVSMGISHRFFSLPSCSFYFILFQVKSKWRVWQCYNGWAETAKNLGWSLEQSEDPDERLFVWAVCLPHWLWWCHPKWQGTLNMSLLSRKG